MTICMRPYGTIIGYVIAWKRGCTEPSTIMNQSSLASTINQAEQKSNF